MLIVLLGPPAAGKGTQAENIIRYLGIPHISTGSLLRENIKKNTQLGKIAAQYINKGDLVPDEVIIAEIKQRLLKSDCRDGALLDGFPRTLKQAKELDKIVVVDKVIDIQPKESTLIQRVATRQTCERCGKAYHHHDSQQCSCGGMLYKREDDTKQAFANRLANYRALTLPITKYYKAQDKLISIDGEGTEQQVFSRIKENLQGAISNG